MDTALMVDEFYFVPALILNIDVDQCEALAKD